MLTLKPYGNWHCLWFWHKWVEKPATIRSRMVVRRCARPRCGWVEVDDAPPELRLPRTLERPVNFFCFS